MYIKVLKRVSSLAPTTLTSASGENLREGSFVASSMLRNSFPPFLPPAAANNTLYRDWFPTRRERQDKNQITTI